MAVVAAGEAPTAAAAHPTVAKLHELLDHPDLASALAACAPSHMLPARTKGTSRDLLGAF